jgi:hypothetical protein
MRFRDEDDENNGMIRRPDGLDQWSRETRVLRLKEILSELEHLMLEVNDIVIHSPEINQENVEWVMNILQSLNDETYGVLFEDEPTMLDTIRSMDKSHRSKDFNILPPPHVQTRSEIVSSIGNDWC